MNFQSKSQLTGFSIQDSEIATINTTPLVDVMLVLLMIFMITIPILVSSYPLNLPNEKNTNILSNAQSIEIIITKNKKTSINIPNLSKNSQNFIADNISAYISKIQNQHPAYQFVIVADKDLEFATIADILSALKNNGVDNVGFKLQH